MPTLYMPTIPLTPLDLINRRDAATGSPARAHASSAADYNGHHVSIQYLPDAFTGPKWVASYYWGERVYLGRGTLPRCIGATRGYYDSGPRGAGAQLTTSEHAPETVDAQVGLAELLGFHKRDESNGRRGPWREPWWTGAHAAVVDALNWDASRNPGLLEHALAYRGAEADWPAERERWRAELCGCGTRVAGQ